MNLRYKWPILTGLTLLLLLVIALPESVKPWAPSFLRSPTFHLGLDLAGGTQLDFRISEEEMNDQIRQLTTDIENTDSAEERSRLQLQLDALRYQKQTIVEAIRSVLEKRVNALGVSEAVITPSYIGNEKHLLVECPGVIDPQECINNVGKTINLEFKEEYEGETEEQETAMRTKANAVEQRIEQGEEFSIIAQDIASDLSITSRPIQNYFQDELPEDLHALWNKQTGLHIIEAALPTVTQSPTGEYEEGEQRGLFLINLTQPATQTGRSVNDPSKALKHLGQTQGTFVEYDNTAIDNSISADIQEALSTMASGDLRAVGNQEQSNIIFLRSFTPGREEVSASHILVAYKGASRADADITRTKEEALTRANELKAQLDAGANFATLAQAESDGPSAEDGGSLGTFGRGDGYVFAFEEAAFNLSQGEVSSPVETEFGYHLIRADNAASTTQDRATFSVLALNGTTKEQAEDIISDIRDGNITTQETIVGFESLFFSFTPSGWKDTPLDGKHFQSATVTLDQIGTPSVQILFDSEGGKLFQEITRRNINKQLAIFVGGNLVSAPRVNAEIAGGSAVITGDFTFEEANTLARDLNTGAIPAPIYLAGQRTVEASLGDSALQTSLQAALIGLIILMAYLIVMYRLPGFLANLALNVYAIIFVALLKLPLFLFSSDYIVLTLAGMAGIILSIGMAVDANILIFERMKEELRRGKSIKVAAETGFKRAWPSIRDGNVSTFITCIILFSIGTSIVKGFAATLGMGVAISMFSAIVVTRWLLGFIARTEFAEKNAWLFGK